MFLDQGLESYLIILWLPIMNVLWQLSADFLGLQQTSLNCCPNRSNSGKANKDLQRSSSEKSNKNTIRNQNQLIQNSENYPKDYNYPMSVYLRKTAETWLVSQ